MESQLGLLFAFVALFGWGFGDFLIQKSTRNIGAHKTLFITGAIACVGLFPFVYDKLFLYSARDYLFLSVLSLIVLAAALLLFEALRVGKISVIEAVIGIELPLTVLLSIFVGGESLTFAQVALFFCIMFGVLLAVASRIQDLHYHKRLFEKGVLLAVVASFLSALCNYYTGTFARSIDPLVTIWVAHSLLALWCGAHMWYRGEFASFVRGVRKHPYPALGQGVIDNVAWVGFAFAATTIPISIATSISESYVILAALLGFLVGGEALRAHQVVGAALAFVGVIFLASTI